MTRKRKTEARKKRKLRELNTNQKINKKQMKKDQGGKSEGRFDIPGNVYK